MKTDGKKFTILADNPQSLSNQANTGARTPLQVLQGNINSTASSATKKTAVKDILTKTAKHAHPVTKVHKGIQVVLNQVTAEDLTSEDKPSEGYYEVLAEKRRVALDEALSENKLLHKRIELLEQKCKYKDSMLEEARALASVLKELLNDD